MAFDIKELMIDLTKVSAGQQFCGPSLPYPCVNSCYFCHPSVQPPLPCRLGTYTCFAGSIVTCGGTIYCAGTQDPTLLLKGMDREVLAEIKAQLENALKEVEQRERNLVETPAAAATEKKK